MIESIVAIVVGAFAGAVSAILTLLWFLVWPIGHRTWTSWGDRTKR